MSLRIIFMGTPEFAIPSLDILVQNDYDIAGVITATDKYGGRGKSQRIESAVKKYAVRRGFNVLQPPNLKAPSFVEDLRALQADLQVVVAFRMLPEVVWSMPPMGTMNLHGSLLPKYRGAAPINWAIINGETTTGVTTFLLKHAIDTGDILLQREMSIGPEETAGDVHDRMMEIGATVVLESVRGLESGTISPVPQSDHVATKAPKIHHDMCRIDFHQSTAGVYNFIRGLSPYPTAWTVVDDRQLNVFKSGTLKVEGMQPGSIHTDNRTFLHVGTRDGAVELLNVQMEGRKRMGIRDFLNGYTVRATTVAYMS